MSKIRVLLLSILGFGLPIFFAAFAVPILFSRSVGKDSYVRARLLGADSIEQQAAEGPTDKTESNESEESFYAIDSDETLDPAKSESFLVSMLLRLDRLPEAGRRQKLIYKYAAKNAPYEGWALAVHNSVTSVRPEVYWRSSEGKGGWFTFDEVQFEIGVWYSLSLVANTNHHISVFLTKLDPLLDPIHAEHTSEGLAYGMKPRDVVFLGGFDVAEIKPPATGERLFVRAGGDKSDGFFADVADVFIGKGQELPKTSRELRTLLGNGSNALHKRFGEDGVSLSLDAAGVDTSKFKRIVPSPNHTA